MKRQSEEKAVPKITLTWAICGGCGRPSAQTTDRCTVVCDSIASDVDRGMTPYDAVRAHLPVKYVLPEDPTPNTSD